MPAAFLPSRSLIRLTGKDAQDFLQGLITTDIDSLPEGEARPGALLTPQGKILFDFLVWRERDGFVMETETAQREALMRRLTMYKLRAAVDITAGPEDGITVFWGDDSGKGSVKDAAFAKAGIALTRAPGNLDDGSEEAYHALRIEAGISISGHDYALQDAFPHDVLLDQTSGLSFRKGCYVGQEVVSRMQHRGTTRRRVVIVSGDAALPASGTEIVAGGKPVGTLGSVSGNKGLAIVRIDRVGDALARGVALSAGDVAVSLALPAWSGLSFPAEAEEAET
ncbi:CAF17-like 4Fe-4S cluster assembly/insertion protein YgfZ [Neorhizobium galegae]|uniref:Folate-binding protein YgfZ n=1 Tax=Neorhizobium galegae bv. orientalis str. HAMBI 540 TaxID=1028800 RepID=A0A068SMV3_NEOGA|nr:folate-binding protein YgfZ [Neorhizobium galegae]MCQ1850133.1 folate-binding protein YgfZ [Neorhizobium galegae]CDN47179.1 Folate-binding protein YgfZ [Neorhizobium galegae bv. orientalis str. HAMBI 540]